MRPPVPPPHRSRSVRPPADTKVPDAPRVSDGPTAPIPVLRYEGLNTCATHAPGADQYGGEGGGEPGESEAPAESPARQPPEPPRPPSRTRHRQQENGRRAQHRHDRRQPRQERAELPREIRAPHGRGRHRPRQRPSPPPTGPVRPPQHDGPATRQRGQRYRDHPHVVRVTPHAPRAEDQEERRQPGPPEQEPCTQPVGTRPSPAPQQPAYDTQGGERIQPPGLRGERGPEHLRPAVLPLTRALTLTRPPPLSATTESTGICTRTRRRHPLTAPLSTPLPMPTPLSPAHTPRRSRTDPQRGEPVQEVVPDHHAERGVVRRPVHIGPILRRHQRHRHHPRHRHSGHHHTGHPKVNHPAPQGNRRRHQIHDGQRGQHRPRLQHLALEPDPDPHPRDDQRPHPPVPRGPLRRLSREQHAQRERRVLDSRTEQPDRDRRQQEGRAGDECRVRARPAGHEPVQHEHARHALDHLRKDQRPRMESEDTCGQRLWPEESGEFVERDRIPGVERAVEERFPVLRHAARGIGVERVVRTVVDSPRVEHGGEHEEAQQRRSRVGGLVGGGAPGCTP